MVTVTVRKDPMTGMTVLPAAVGIGADSITMENGPRGIVTSGDPPAGAGAGTEGVASSDAPGFWIDTGGVGVGVADVMSVTKLDGLAKGVTVVEARRPVEGSLEVDSDTGATPGVPETVVTRVVETRTVTVSSFSLDGDTAEPSDAARGVSDARSGSLNGTVVVAMVDIWRVTVLPAGMDGLTVAGTAILSTDCSGEPALDTGTTVVASSGSVAVDVSMVGIGEFMLVAEDVVGDLGAEIGASTVLLVSAGLLGVAALPMVPDDPVVWAAKTGSVPVFTVDETMSVHDSDVELEGADPTFSAAVCADGASLTVTDGED